MTLTASAIRSRGSGPSARGEKRHEYRTCPVDRAGFPEPKFHGEIIAESERLRETDTVRVIDALAVHKDAAVGLVSTQEAAEMHAMETAAVGSS